MVYCPYGSWCWSTGRELPLKSTGKSGEYLQAHLGIHHPIRVDVLDTWGRRSLGACSYHVWHPEGRAFESPPLTRFEAATRRSQRFVVEGPMRTPVKHEPTTPHPDTPYTLALRRFAMDHPMPQPDEASTDDDAAEASESAD